MWCPLPWGMWLSCQDPWPSPRACYPGCMLTRVPALRNTPLLTPSQPLLLASCFTACLIQQCHAASLTTCTSSPALAETLLLPSLTPHMLCSMLASLVSASFTPRWRPLRPSLSPFPRSLGPLWAGLSVADAANTSTMSPATATLTFSPTNGWYQQSVSWALTLTLQTLPGFQAISAIQPTSTAQCPLASFAKVFLWSTFAAATLPRVSQSLTTSPPSKGLLLALPLQATMTSPPSPVAIPLTPTTSLSLHRMPVLAPLGPITTSLQSLDSLSPQVSVGPRKPPLLILALISLPGSAPRLCPPPCTTIPAIMTDPPSVAPLLPLPQHSRVPCVTPLTNS